MNKTRSKWIRKTTKALIKRQELSHKLINYSQQRGYAGIHSTGFKDFLLKEELNRAISDCGFECPSEGNK